jgi:3-phosphoshikimate 1-carboxyvinyltransferase
MPGQYIVESDWSGASYWYAMVALSKQGRLQLNGLRQNSFQGDQKISQIMRNLGVETSYNAKGILIARTNELKLEELDFSDTPDLAQTLAAVSAGLGRQLTMTGIESLRIKETDRISALQNELRKIGADLREIAGGHWVVSKASKDLQLPETPEIETYEDHRMAMAFAPLAVKTSLRISNPGVVSKSYPNFWEEMEKTGFRIQWIDS